MDFNSTLARHLAAVERGLDLHLPPAATPPARLHAAMRYSLEAGGKRVRPVLVLAAAELFAPPPTSVTDTATAAPLSKIQNQESKIENPTALPAAVAVECLHTYSLIHDDLPCMDDDDLRRGRPTAHRQFDEATALLAGDALLTHAFALLATAYAATPVLAHALVHELADAAGSRRLIGGQMQDLLSEKKTDATAAQLDYIHLNKTAAMLEASLALGGLVGGASDTDLTRLRAAGRHLGLAFQIIDDLLDATADSATLGKTAGKDARAGKTTYVSLHGLDASRRFAADHTAAAETALAALPGDTSFLRAFFDRLARRQA